MRVLRRGSRRGRRRARTSTACSCLRPTASATVFTQQLGRGLRRAAGKSHLTVIDLIGQHRREFRFEDRLRAILDTRRGPVIDQVARRLPVPAGRVHRRPRPPEPRDHSRQPERRRSPFALGNARRRSAASRTTQPGRVPRSPRPPPRGRVPGGSWTRLRRDAGERLRQPTDAALEARTLSALGRLTHVDDPERVALLRASSSASTTARARRDLDDARAAADDARVGLWDPAPRPPSRSPSSSTPLWRERRGPRRAARSCSTSSTPRRARRRRPQSSAPKCRSRCTRATRGRRSSRRSDSATASNRRSRRAASFGSRRRTSDVFFVDLHKAERDYSPTTMYRDYAINRELFHWESQSRQTPRQPTVQRYINHVPEARRVLLFVRERKTFELGTQPFTFLGPATTSTTVANGQSRSRGGCRCRCQRNCSRSHAASQPHSRPTPGDKSQSTSPHRFD